MEYKFEKERGVFKLYKGETGKDWSNHLFNGLSYVTSITHYGVPWSRYIDENSVQVTLNCPLTSFVYIRDGKTKNYWNIAGYPSLKKIKKYCCEHGQEYTKISSEYLGIEGSVTYSIAKDDTREVWKVTLRNRTERRRELDIFAVTAFDLNGYAQPVYYSAVTTSATEYVEEANGIYNGNLNPYRPHNRSSGYIISSERVKAYDGNYEKFIGTLGTQTKPLVLERGIDCTNSLATVRQRGGILENEMILEAGEEKSIYYVLGLIGSKEELIANYHCFIEESERIISDSMESERYGELRTKSPEKQINRIMNYWAEHQVSYCMLGKKAVRDNAQLALAMLNYDVAQAKKTIDECVSHQYSDGHSVLTWYPYLEQNIYSDPSAWLVFAVCEYLKETGDMEYLEKRLPWLDGGEGRVREHLEKALEWFGREDNYGPHGLPKIHHADWNDALNIPDEEAESVFMGMLICKVYEEMSRLFEYMGEEEAAKELREKKARLAEMINAEAYNGEYYVRAFSKFGVVGDKSSENGGKIYINPQSWSILSGVCPKERIEKVVKAIDGMESEEGIPMCAPSYKKYDERVGRMSGMLAGVYENGGIYNHAGCFKVMADCKLKRGSRAVETLKKIIPDGAKNPSSKTTAEPYVFTNCYLKHPTVDMEVGFSWQTGTSAWGLMCYYEGILGLQRDYDGLRIDPALPEEWKRAEAWRNYRGNRLHIRYINEGGNKAKLKVDGKEIAGNKLPKFSDQCMHEITVTMRKENEKDIR